MEPAELSTMLKPFLRRRQKSQWKENHTVATLREPIRSGLDRFFFLVPFKESRFPLFGISKLFKPANEALDPSLKDLARQGLISFTKHKRPISSEDLEVLQQIPMNAPESFSNLACFNTILYFGKRGRENQREMKPGDL